MGSQLTKLFNIIKQEGIHGIFSRISTHGKSKLDPSSRFSTIKGTPGGFALFVSGESKNSPVRYRCEIPAEYLSSQNLKSDVIYYKFLTPEILDAYKYIVWYRIPLNAEVQKFVDYLKQKNRKIIYSIDDLLFDEDSIKSQSWFKDLQNSEKEKLINESNGIKTFMENSDLFISSTDSLASEMNQVKSIPTLTLNNSYSNSEKEISNQYLNSFPQVPTVGIFSGSYTHDYDFELIEKQLLNLLETTNIEINIVGRINISESFNKFNNKVVRFPFLPIEKYIEVMSKCSLVLNPLVQNKHNFSKSETKYLQAGLLKRPIMSSTTSWMSKVIQDGKNGFLVKNDIDWEIKLKEVLSSKELLRKAGENAYNDIIVNYSPEKLSSKLSQFLNTNG